MNFLLHELMNYFLKGKVGLTPGLPDLTTCSERVAVFQGLMVLHPDIKKATKGFLHSEIDSIFKSGSMESAPGGHVICDSLHMTQSASSAFNSDIFTRNLRH